MSCLVVIMLCPVKCLCLDRQPWRSRNTPSTNFRARPELPRAKMEIRTTPPAPLLLAADAPNCMRVLWTVESTVTRVTLWMRPVGQATWLVLDSSTGTLVPRDAAQDFGLARAHIAARGETIVKGLSPDKPYEAVLAARTIDGQNSLWSFSAHLQLAQPVAPAAPVLQAIYTGIRVHWSLPPGIPADTVTVHMRKRSEDGWMVVDARTGKLVDRDTDGATSCPGLPSSVLVLGICAGTPYEAKLVAHTAHGSSGFSPVSAMLQLNLPQAPGQPLATASGPTSLRIRFAVPPASPACTHAEVQVQAEGEQTWQKVDSATGKLVVIGGRYYVDTRFKCQQGSSIDVTVSGLHPGCSYTVRAVARNVHGWGLESPVSAAACTGSKPGKPPAPILVIASQAKG